MTGNQHQGGATSSYTCPRCRRTSHHPIDAREQYCSACHAYIDQLMAFQVYVDDTLVLEDWVIVPDGQPDAEAHAAITNQANADGKPWRIEVHDPEAQRAYVMGSSTQGIADPHPINLAEGGRWAEEASTWLGYR